MTFWVAASVFILDRLTKLLAVKNLYVGQSVAVAPDIFHITLVNNSGAAFGIFRAHAVFFALISLAAAIFIIIYITRRKLTGFLLPIALGLVLGGALGNLWDRVRLGYVIDFLDFRIWPVFNIADSCITIGVIILIWRALAQNSKVKSQS